MVLRVVAVAFLFVAKAQTLPSVVGEELEISQDSCAGRCGHVFSATKSCQCNSWCNVYANCCPDYTAQCRPHEMELAQGRTEDSSTASPHFIMQSFNTVKEPELEMSQSSCAGRCGHVSATKDCQCNTWCNVFANCCADYTAQCHPHHIEHQEESDEEAPSSVPRSSSIEKVFKVETQQDSCAGRCGHVFSTTRSCQCNSWCNVYANCCPDYTAQCRSTDAALMSV